MKRLLILSICVLGTVLVLVLADSRRSGDVLEVEEDAPLPHVEVELELSADGMNPHRLRVPKDHRVRLLIHAGPEAPEGLLAIRGYEDRVAPVDLGPGLSRELNFESRLPGDDFAFEMGGRNLGRLEVTGSHLEDGHQ